MKEPYFPGSSLVIRTRSLQFAAPRLKRLNIDVPVLAGTKSPQEEPYQHQLYEFIKDAGGYSFYNALCRRIASFASALEARRAGL
jgi:hypothetical protein